MPRGDYAYPSHLQVCCMLKRVMDVVLATFMLALALPFLILSAILVKLTSKGPVIFEHRRCGLNGTKFGCLKFRTMVVDAQDWLVKDPELKAKYKENGFKLRNGQDPRVTGVGRLLRDTYLDELPQLVNVIRGEMSLVGPRPIIQEELEWYGDDKAELLSVRPGVFGAWTGLGRSRTEYPKRTLAELQYIRDTSQLKDVRILVQHIPVLMRGHSGE